MNACTCARPPPRPRGRYPARGGPRRGVTAASPAGVCVRRRRLYRARAAGALDGAPATLKIGARAARPQSALRTGARGCWCARSAALRRAMATSSARRGGRLATAALLVLGEPPRTRSVPGRDARQRTRAGRPQTRFRPGIRLGGDAFCFLFGGGDFFLASVT